MELVFKGVFRVESNAIHGLVETRPKGVFAASENDIFPPGNQLKSRRPAELTVGLLCHLLYWVRGWTTQRGWSEEMNSAMEPVLLQS